MKKVILLTAIVLSASLFSYAQDATLKQQELKIDFLQFFIMGNFGVQYEKFLHDDQSFGISANYFSVDYWGDHMEGFSALAEYRWYLRYKSENKGWFVAPYLKYRNKEEDGGFGYYVDDNGNYLDEYYYYNGNYTYVDGARKSSGMAFGISGGYKIVLRSDFLFEANLGIGRYIFDNMKFKDDNAEDHFMDHSDWIDRADLKANISIGWRF